MIPSHISRLISLIGALFLAFIPAVIHFAYSLISFVFFPSILGRKLGIVEIGSYLAYKNKPL